MLYPLLFKNTLHIQFSIGLGKLLSILEIFYKGIIWKLKTMSFCYSWSSCCDGGISVNYTIRIKRIFKSVVKISLCLWQDRSCFKLSSINHCTIHFWSIYNIHYITICKYFLSWQINHPDYFMWGNISKEAIT